MPIGGSHGAALDSPTIGRHEPMRYDPDSYLSAVSRRQRAYLRLLVRTSFPDRRPVQHDFACGTGGIVRLLHGIVRDAHGYDSSAERLEVAHAAGLRAHWHEVRAHGAVPQPETTEGPAIVTVFRLLAAASDEERDRAIAFAARALPSHTSGLLIVENHESADSLRALRRVGPVARPAHAGPPSGRGGRWTAPRPRTGSADDAPDATHRWAEPPDATHRWAEPPAEPATTEPVPTGAARGLTHLSVATLLRRYGFTIVERRGFSLLPQCAYRVRLLRPLVRRLDGLLCRWEFLSRYATDVLYIARRTRVAPRPQHLVRG